MNKHNHPFDDELRKKEEQSLPDLTELETHFNQFRQKNTPVERATRTPRKYIWWGAAIAAALLTAYLIGNRSNTLSPEITPDVPLTKEVSIPAHDNFNDTGNFSSITRPLPIGPAQMASSDRSVNKSNRTRGYLHLTRQSNSGPNDTLTLTNPDDSQLAKWLKAAKKAPTSFLINNERDTILSTNEGSVFLIPAHVFPRRGLVQLLIREFYSLDEMLTERLHTLSSGQLLETGGMLHIAAFQNEEPVQLLPGRSFRWFIKQQDDLANMQLFKGLEGQPDGMMWSGEIKNWEPRDAYFRTSPLNITVLAVDFRLEPSRVRYGKNTRATLFLPRSTEISNDVLRDSVLSKNPQLDYIKIRRLSKKRMNRIAGSRSKSVRKMEMRKATHALRIGDTVRMTLQDAIRYRLPAIDTFFSIDGNSASFAASGTYPNKFGIQMKDRTGVDISELGWINCDRFYRYAGPLYEFAVELPGAAKDYITAVVFSNQKSILYGQRYSRNRVEFGKLPAGEEITVISFGIQSEQLIVSSVKTIIGEDTVLLPPYSVSLQNDLKTVSRGCWASEKTE